MIAPPKGENLQDLFASASPLEPGPSGIKDLFDAILANRPAWHADALCREHPEVNFFPVRGEDVGPAKRLCGQCLVKRECGEWAAAQGPELKGVWAGTTDRQRQRMRAMEAITDPWLEYEGVLEVAAAAFLDQRCARSVEAETSAAALYAAFRGWAEAAGGKPTGRRRFGEALAACGLEPFRTHSARMWRGVALKAAEGEPATVEATDPPGRSTAA